MGGLPSLRQNEQVSEQDRHMYQSGIKPANS